MKTKLTFSNRELAGEYKATLIDEVKKVSNNNKMKLEEQVCNAEFAKELKELGVKQESKFYWEHGEDAPEPYLITDESELQLEDGYNVENSSAFTVAELGVLLLEKVEKYSVYVFPENLWNGRDENGTAEGSNEANLRAIMLIRALS
ncbi:hypothetical protein FORMB_19110 [Formosa sp. Hel1_33_131]|uniref:hypothetical protein n=1 Tax=Formosa sp. Hel1_33_131 TaxID=1336794 RepID=UPI000865CBE1|nr:hypothetical protein [Formosa sp. Hel1_33_131]AOR28941.1 hypothetical protein FORMB_19110 [Formosa sp. Hel1_33_131]